MSSLKPYSHQTKPYAFSSQILVSLLTPGIVFERGSAQWLAASLYSVSIYKVLQGRCNVVSEFVLSLTICKLSISFKILLFVFKAIHGFAPTYLRELVSIKRSGNYNLRSSSDGLLLATPSYRRRVTLGDRSFQVAAPALWNVLPREIRSITDLGIFKRHLKTYLFREAFY